MSAPLEIFCCYAREDQEMLEHLKKHLAPLERQGQITIWSDTNLNAGVEWEKELHQHLESADIILLLISPNFMVSDYCYSTEMGRAIARHNEGKARVIPIILRPVDWYDAPFGKLQALPSSAQAVTIWRNKDKAFLDISQGLRKAVEELKLKKASPSFLPPPQLDRLVANTITELLNILSIASLYDFLGLGSETLSTSELWGLAEQKYLEAVRAYPTMETTAKRELAGYARDIFRSEEMRKKYDETLRQKSFNKLLEKIEEVMSHTVDKRLSVRQVILFLKDAEKIKWQREEALQRLQEYVRLHKWSMDVPSYE